MKKIGIIGAGSWGTALAVTLAGKGHSVRLSDVDKAHLKYMKEHRENRKYLSGVFIPEGVVMAESADEALKGADVALFAVPSQHFRSAFKNAVPYLTGGMIIVNVAKGIEQGTLMRMSEIALSLLPDAEYAVLSGPSHAEEVGRKLPTTVAVASKDMKIAEEVQNIFITENFRVYTNDDVTGVELGGALKNIIALGAGISDGIGFGDNAKAALMTRGITEICRLGVKLGADAATFWGLTGIGDLIVTCTSMHSRNRRCGIMIGRGVPPEEAVKRVGMVVEGVYTAEAAYQLAKRMNVEMPISNAIYRCLRGEVTPKEAVVRLMTRGRKNEKFIT